MSKPETKQALSPRHYRRQIEQIRKWRRHHQWEKAEHWARRLLVLCPQLADAHYELGRMAELRGQLNLSYREYQDCLRINSRQADAWYRCGLIAERQGHVARAVEAFGKHLKLRGEKTSINTYLHLAQDLSQLQHDKSALLFYLKALEKDSTHLLTYFHLSQSLEKLGDLNAALDCLMSLGKLYPAKLDLLSIMMGHLLEKNGEYASALACYDEALKRRPQQWLWRLKRDLAFPLVPESREEIERFRQQMEAALEQALERLKAQPLRLRQEEFFFLTMMHGNAVYTSYHHYPQKRLCTLLAQLIQAVLKPPEPWQAPGPKAGPKHLGVMLAPKSVALGFLYVGSMADRLDPNEFRVTIFCQSTDVLNLFQKGGRYFFQNDHVGYQLISADVYESIRQVRAAAPDVFFFTEPGWDFRQYILALFRVAPVQCTSWMTPGTTGLKNMDYFISTSLLERPDAQEDYTEKLELWPVFPSWVPSFVFPEPVPRSYFGLQDEWHLYACLQNLLKFHPDFDLIVAEILRRDPLGHLILLSSRGAHLAELLTQRFQRRIPDVMDRIWVFPELPNEDFLKLLETADVVLDPIYYGGGTTTYQALAWGLPIVTLPTERMVGRITASVCRHLGVTENIVSSPEEYILKAVALGQDPKARSRTRQILRKNYHQIYEDPEVIRCFREFLLRVSS